MKKKIRFIINPFSGIGQKKIVPQLLDRGIDPKKYEWDIVYTKRAKQATEISREAVALGYNGVVAVGGDGSVNEIARALIGTDTALGIIPGGSGNGIARSLELPLKVSQAIENINRFHLIKIDTGLLNDQPFIGVAGLGFDAMISKEFANRKLRGKMSYGYIIAKKMNAFKPMQIKISGEQNLEMDKAVVLTFANTSQYGNNAYIAPTASVADGHLKLTIIEKFKLWQLPDITQKVFRKKIHQSSKVSSLEFDEIEVHHQSEFAHLDGEPIKIPPVITVKVVPMSLKVIGIA